MTLGTMGVSSNLLLQPQPDCRCHMLPSWSAKEESSTYLAEKDLPWYADKPRELIRLQEQLGAKRLISAFGIAVSDPMYEEEVNIAIAASYLAGTVVQPGETASLNSIIGPFTAERGYAKGPTSWAQTLSAPWQGYAKSHRACIMS